MKEALLDTNIVSEFLRANRKVTINVEQYLNHFEFINFSIITYYEIMNGLLYKDARKQLEKFELFVGLNKIIPITLNMAKIAAEIKADLRRKGIEIGHADILIAGIAIGSGFQLITNNTEHFKQVPNLDIDNWNK